MKPMKTIKFTIFPGTSQWPIVSLLYSSFPENDSSKVYLRGDELC